MISNQIRILRSLAQRHSGTLVGETLFHASDTIEELSAKLAKVNMDQSTAYYNNGWIPISSGNLPNERKEVWCVNAHGAYMAGRLYWHPDKEDYICRNGFDWMTQVVAWMPIVPYKEGD